MSHCLSRTLIVLFLVVSSGCAGKDPYFFQTERDLLRDYEPRIAPQIVRAGIEIPAGTNAKWEVDKLSGNLRWEFKEGRPRVVQYLPYPVNYGMVPRTNLSKDFGGDGDPLDIVVLGEALGRGEVVPVKIIGVMWMIDRGEKDHKMVAVPLQGLFSEIQSIEELDEKYPGVTAILETWFSHYKGEGLTQIQGFGTVEEAETVLRQSLQAFQK